MPLIGFACPLCGGCFSMWIENMLDSTVIVEDCPYCQKKIELAAHHVTAESCVQVINDKDWNQ